MFTLTSDAASGDKPRQIGAGPTFDIVRLLNAMHIGKELFRPYEQVDFGQRLSRSVEYGWGDVYGRYQADRLVAVAGLWKGTVADYGYEPGAEDEMVALCRSLVARASRPGHEGLTLFPDPASALFARLQALPHSQLELLFYAPRIESSGVNHVVYIDPVYF
jgi:hypothetical protein